MNVSILALSRFAQRGAAAQAAVDYAIERADLVALVARRKHELVAIRLQRDDAVTDAQLKFGLAAAALDEFDARPVSA